MAALIAYMMIAGMIIYFISRKGRPFSSQPGRALPDASQRKKSGLQEGSREIWKQVYETASMDEARSIQTCLEKEGIDCILYEQGKKDIHGNLLKGVGVAVPGVAALRAQECITKMPV
ncbi:MAG TPA: hypothetical protein PLO78_09800 [Candidatus Omnitrophota bacterium]|nr:hypothetical protein [Candidatus Omnitrophota bacterium]